MSGEDPLFPVGFDDAAMAEDLDRSSESAEEALTALRAEVEQLGGLPRSRLKACEDDAREPKARGFELILGITIRDIDYLEGAIQTGILVVAISDVRDRLPYGIVCGVRIPVRGLGAKSGRTVMVTTAWMLDEPGAAPRLVNALIRN